MDPISIVGLVATCVSLGSAIFKIKSALSTLSEKFKTSQLAISALVSQLQALETCVSELEILLSESSSPSSSSTPSRREKRVLPALGQCLTSTDTVIQSLWTHVSEAQSDIESGKGLTRWTRTKHVMNEDALVPLKEALRDQVQAMQLLLSVLSLKTEAEQDAVLDDAESIVILKRARDDSSSLLWLRDDDSRASFISYESDTLSRLSMIFGFDQHVLESKPYRKAVIASWKQLRKGQRNGGRPPSISARPPDSRLSMVIQGRSESDIAYQLSGMKSAVAMIVRYDFHASFAVELECKAGEILIPVAISNKEWVVAKPIGRIGGPGLVPVSFVNVVARSGESCETPDDVIRELRAVGIPSVEEWKYRAAAYRNAAIPLGKFEQPVVEEEQVIPRGELLPHPNDILPNFTFPNREDLTKTQSSRKDTIITDDRLNWI